MSRPTHLVRIWDSLTGRYTNAGVAWIREDGASSVVLGPGVSFSYADHNAGLRLKMFKLEPDAKVDDRIDE